MELAVIFAWTVMYYVIFRIQDIRDKVESSSHTELELRLRKNHRRMILFISVILLSFSVSLVVYIIVVFVQGITDYYNPKFKISMAL